MAVFIDPPHHAPLIGLTPAGAAGFTVANHPCAAHVEQRGRRRPDEPPDHRTRTGSTLGNRRHEDSGAFSMHVGTAEQPPTGPLPASVPDQIAIVGIGCRYPGGVRDPRSFWNLLESRRDALQDIPPDRWRLESFFDPDPRTPGRMSVQQGGFLDTPLDSFDAGFFGMPPREAAHLDPQQRILLEVTWEA